MKRKSFYTIRIVAGIIMMVTMQAARAEGFPTSNSHSPQYFRMLSRNASTQIDAVYYNPAGVASLGNGFHFAVNDQFLMQKNNISSSYPVLSDGEYTGGLIAPMNPSVFLAYRTGNLAFSLGSFLVTGSMNHDDGLPYFEIPASRQVPDLTVLSRLPFPEPNFDVTSYFADISYEARSIYSGIQAGASYNYENIVSFYAGVRAVIASNRYLEFFKDAQLMVNNELVPASEWLSTTALPAATNHRNAAITDATKCQQLISLGAGSYTLSQVQSAGYISSAERARLESDLRNYAGLSSAQIAALNINQAYTRFNSALMNFTAATVKISEAVNILDDKESDMEQRGTGLTPILGMNVNLGKSFNLGMKYEFRTSLSMTNNVIVDDFEIYTDEAEVIYEIPAILAVGAGYRLRELLEVQVSFNIWFDKHIYWGQNLRDYLTAASEDDIRDRELKANTWELALGLQYNLSSKIALSLGCMTSQPAPEDSFQYDFGYTSPSVTAGGGIRWKLTESLTLDAGIMNAFYRDVNVTYTDAKLQEWFTKYPELYGGPEYSDGEFRGIYSKNRLGISVGLSYSILK